MWRIVFKYILFGGMGFPFWKAALLPEIPLKEGRVSVRA